MAIRDLGTIVADALIYIQSKIPSLTLLTGSVARDVVVDAPAQEHNRLWTELDRVQRQQTLSDDAAFTDEELTKLAGSYGLQRLGGTAATGIVTFRLRTFSISSADVTIPVGTELSTRAGVVATGALSFTTTAESTFVAANAETYFNPATNLYEIDVPVQASDIGTIGNVAADTITVLISSIEGAPTVTNSIVTSGGSETETNAALLARILTKVVGTAAGTVSGLQSLINSNSNVIASLVIVPGDEELVRDEFGNAADVLIIGEILTSVTDTKAFTSGVTSYTLNRQPVSLEDNVADTIEGVVGGVAFVFIKDTHYRVIVDTASISGGSTQGTTKIEFLGSPFPDNASIFTVTYSVNNLIEVLQAAVDADDVRIIGTDIRVREATKVLVRVGAFIKVLPGYTKADVAAEAEANVADLLNSSTLDENLDQSDIIATIQNTAGVDAVTVPISLEVKRPTDADFIITSDISTARTEYVRPDPSSDAIVIT